MCIGAGSTISLLKHGRLCVNKIRIGDHCLSSFRKEIAKPTLLRDFDFYHRLNNVGLESGEDSYIHKNQH